MKKFDIVVLIALASYVATEFLNNVFNTLYDKHMKSFVENYITIVAKYITITEIIVIVVCVFLIILLYFVWKYHLKSKELEKELEKEKKKYEKHMGYGIAVRALIVEIENILTDILQEAKDVSMYIVHKDTIYNFLTLPYDTTGIHHQNKTFTLDRNTIIGQAFLNKEESERKLSDSSQTSQELEKSIKMYNLDPNDYLITIPYKKKDNSVLFALQVITDESDSSKKRTIKNNLSKIKNPLENLMELPDWESLIPKLKTDSTEINGGFLFFDLSNSSDLLELLTLEQAQNEINNFITIMCDVAIDKGGKIDKYTGDGGFITFMQDTQGSNFEQNLIDASIKMLKEMSRLRHMWKGEYSRLTQEDVDKFKIRIGISSGQVRPFTIGHKDYKYDTYFGQAIHTAYHLCEGSDSLLLRDRLLIDGRLIDNVPSDGVEVAEYDSKTYKFSKSAKFSEEIYEISLMQ